MHGAQTQHDDPEVVDALVDALQRFAGEAIDAPDIDRRHRIPRDLLAQLGELGVFGLSLPEAYGGAGLGMGAVMASVAALAEVDRSVATTVGLHLGLGSRGLVAFGSDALKERLLPDLASGARIAAFAATEPNAGSDLHAVSTRAEAQPDGRLRVDGSKVFVTNGGFAGVFTILARTPGLGGRRKGHGLIVLERGDPGLTVGPEEDKLGLRGSSTTTLHFDGVTVDPGRLIGPPGDGMRQMNHVLAWGRSVMAAGCVGAATGAIRAALAHIQTRRQFGRALVEFPVVQAQVAELAALHFAMRSLTEHVAAESDDDDVLLCRSIAAKVLCSDGNWEISDRAVQLFGGSGFIEETGAPLRLRDARITRIFEGANDVLLVHAGTLEATAPRPRASLAAELRHPAAAAADSLHATLTGFRGELAAAHGIRLLRRQRLLHQLGQLSVWSQAADAAVWAARSHGTSDAFDLAGHWCEMVERRWASARIPAADGQRVRTLVASAIDRLS